MNPFLFPIIAQSIIFSIDEFVFHKKRKLPQWEIFGHPIDTLFYLIPLGLCTFSVFDLIIQKCFIILSIVSCIIVTKDEWIHKKECTGFENWLHSLLFALHPLSLISIWNLKIAGEEAILYMTFSSVLVVFIFQSYQLCIYLLNSRPQEIDTSHYSFLGEGWYKFNSHPVALLRAQSHLFSKWLNQRYNNKNIKILDNACGAGFLANSLALNGYTVFGIDLNTHSLEIAKTYDKTNRVVYLSASAFSLPFEDETFDLVCLMDFLEHVDEPLSVFKEASRVLKPGGEIVFHTFNRTFLSWILAVKAISILFPYAPENIHIYKYFRKPQDIENCANQCGLYRAEPWKGVKPKTHLRNLMKIFLFGEVAKDFEFEWSIHNWISYVGVFKKSDF